MLRRILIASVAILLVGILIAIIVVRQIVFGGTPTIHHTARQPVLAASPCATVTLPAGAHAFNINAQMSNASYEAHFQAAGQPLPGTVTGITGDVSGEFLLSSDTHPTIMSLKIVIDLRSLNSGAPERDLHVANDSLETAKYPFTTFVVSQAQVLPGSYIQGQSVNFKLQGQLTLHGVTRSVTFDMQGKLAGNTVTGSGSTLIHLQDYKMKTPEITSVVTVTVSKDITLMISFTAQQESCLHSI